VTQRLLMLIGGSALLWLLLGLPARHLGGGDDALKYAGAAALLCTVPMALSLVLTTRLAAQKPQMLAVGVLGATGVRMFVVLGAGLLLGVVDPYFGGQAFWLWLVVFYLATLALDVGLLLAGQPSRPVN
jgi:hypothetical protein